MNTDPLNIIKYFSTDAEAISCERYAGGFINISYLVTDASGHRYLLQRISGAAFKDVPSLMNNFRIVTEHLSSQVADERACLHMLPSVDGASYVKDEEEAYWRVLRFVENSVCFHEVDSPEVFYESAVALGTFIRLLSDMPADRLIDTIPDFHNTPKRFNDFHEIIRQDPLGRLDKVREEADFLLSLEAKGASLTRMRDAGTLPVRVVHNDAKTGNVLLDRDTLKALCVVDLDTVMPGLSAYDFGEAIRSGASGGKEDEQDLTKIGLDLDLVKTFAEGFISSCGVLTKEEIMTLPEGAMIMTLENAIRMLGDYIAGDVYYTISYPEQNLDRARTQIKMLKEYERYEEDLRLIVNRYL